MKRLILAMFLLGFGFASQAQVQDNAVIPISVTVNSVLRLHVNSGGNIQFVFNTMDQFEGGIKGNGNTTTKFIVASSRKYDVHMSTEDGDLMGISTPSTAPLALITYAISGTGVQVGSGTALAHDPQLIVLNPNPANNEQYEILWEAGRGSVSATNLAPDTYITNVFLTLKATE